jgi:hypothetical protein
MCGVIPSVLANEKNLVPVLGKWGKGKEEQGTRVMLYSYHTYVVSKPSSDPPQTRISRNPNTGNPVSEKTSSRQLGE